MTPAEMPRASRGDAPEHEHERGIQPPQIHRTQENVIVYLPEVVVGR